MKNKLSKKKSNSSIRKNIIRDGRIGGASSVDDIKYPEKKKNKKAQIERVAQELEDDIKYPLKKKIRKHRLRG